jgi:hypothetical protein
MADHPNSRVRKPRFNNVAVVAIRLPLVQRLEIEELADRAGVSMSDFMRVYVLYPFLNTNHESRITKG